MNLLLGACIFVGAGLGGLLRYFVGTWTQRLAGGMSGVFAGSNEQGSIGWPIGTLVVNVTGCVVVGALAVWLSPSSALREEFKAGIFWGILGGYTTFSSFGRETFELFQRGQWWGAGTYVLLSNILGLLGVGAGWAMATRLSVWASQR